MRTYGHHETLGTPAFEGFRWPRRSLAAIRLESLGQNLYVECSHEANPQG
jgi:hypothetical protein